MVHYHARRRPRLWQIQDLGLGKVSYNFQSRKKKSDGQISKVKNPRWRWGNRGSPPQAPPGLSTLLDYSQPLPHPSSLDTELVLDSARVILRGCHPDAWCTIHLFTVSIMFRIRRTSPKASCFKHMCFIVVPASYLH